MKKIIILLFILFPLVDLSAAKLILPGSSLNNVTILEKSYLLSESEMRILSRKNEELKLKYKEIECLEQDISKLKSIIILKDKLILKYENNIESSNIIINEKEKVIIEYRSNLGEVNKLLKEKVKENNQLRITLAGKRAKDKVIVKILKIIAPIVLSKYLFKF